MPDPFLLEQLNRVDLLVDMQVDYPAETDVRAASISLAALAESAMAKAIIKAVLVAGKKVLTIVYNALGQLIEEYVDDEEPAVPSDPA